MPAANELELRISLVCYGGISLAVYMHGISKEVLKLVRASKLYHGVTDRVARQNLHYADVNDDPGRETDTEDVYFELLKALGRTLDLRVIVDVISGTSAGGINGIMLARALAHDLPLDAHRAMWLELADITELMDQRTMAGRWSKLYMQPLLWHWGRGRSDHEIRAKISTFLRSRWFRPPFSGDRFTTMLLDALHAMGEPRPNASLLPAGHRLDLFVSVTDFHGYSQSIALHDPPVVNEREHRHVLSYSYLRRKDGQMLSDFTAEQIPALAFAARATSSYAGAFPPFQFAELDRVLTARRENWPGRRAFSLKQFRAVYESGGDPTRTTFIDGGVLNNKPFHEAIQALNGRPAHRQVERFLVYIEPSPESIQSVHDARPPGFFQTLRGSLSDILRNQPIRDELEWLQSVNEHKRRLKQIVDAMRPGITDRVAEIVGNPDARLRRLHLRHARLEAEARAARQAGYAFEGYLQLRLNTVLDNLAERLGQVGRTSRQAPARQALIGALHHWAREQSILSASGQSSNTEDRVRAARADFLNRFNVHYRVRRLRLVIRRLNELYPLPQVSEDHRCRALLGEFKTALYERLETLLLRLEPAFYDAKLRSEAVVLLQAADLSVRRTELHQLLQQLGKAMALPAEDRVIDALFTRPDWQRLPIDIRRELLFSYIGFPFFDVLTFPIMQQRDLDEFDEVKVVRFSADDAVALRNGGAKATLKGTAFGYFGGFFSRRYRENDYLWGRLHAADRLIDIVLQAAFERRESRGIDGFAFKARAFETILEHERRYLESSDALIMELQQKIAEFRLRSEVLFS